MEQQEINKVNLQTHTDLSRFQIGQIAVHEHYGLIKVKQVINNDTLEFAIIGPRGFRPLVRDEHMDPPEVITNQIITQQGAASSRIYLKGTNDAFQLIVERAHKMMPIRLTPLLFGWEAFNRLLQSPTTKQYATDMFTEVHPEQVRVAERVGQFVLVKDCLNKGHSCNRGSYHKSADEAYIIFQKLLAKFYLSYGVDLVAVGALESLTQGIPKGGSQEDHTQWKATRAMPTDVRRYVINNLLKRGIRTVFTKEWSNDFLSKEEYQLIQKGNLIVLNMSTDNLSDQNFDQVYMNNVKSNVEQIKNRILPKTQALVLPIVSNIKNKDTVLGVTHRLANDLNATIQLEGLEDTKTGESPPLNFWERFYWSSYRFKASAKLRKLIKGNSVVFILPEIKTGATLLEVQRALVQSGAVRVIPVIINKVLSDKTSSGSQVEDHTS